MVSLRYEDGVWGAGQACENVRAKVLEDGQLKKIVVCGLESIHSLGI